MTSRLGTGKSLTFLQCILPKFLPLVLRICTIITREKKPLQNAFAMVYHSNVVLFSLLVFYIARDLQLKYL